ncbi:hypothetical protein GQ43DRAFT_425567 [Delitschia confertaspora ATCC 74209]|uniref:magnesium chelatase n=1 Tax=Delitschia confertaspora ATCC 74209 TaxID=1513339 RepID=A0A9P4MNG5_9PLEO|nr:hypothetical protein GQ43DRAFT_425567 [Delitschia confertaspora ATCC 74209]
MDEERVRLAEKVQALSDIELAILLCLVTNQHCIIETDESLVSAVEYELDTVVSDVFGLTCSVLHCSEKTTLDEFGTGILVPEGKEDYFSTRDKRPKDDDLSSYSGSPRLSRRSPRPFKPFIPLDGRRIANVVIAVNLNEADHQVQIQALELIRGKRNFTRTAVHAAPKPFLFVALNLNGSIRLTTHLNDHMFIYHRHQAGDALPYAEDQLRAPVTDDTKSTSSVVRSPRFTPDKKGYSSVAFSEDDINTLTAQAGEVRMSSEVRAYLHNIVVFMRLHRAVAGGISPLATRHLTILSQALAPLHGLSYVSPPLVDLATRKIYPHRIVITTAENERSMQWGSSLEAVRAILEGVTPEDVIEEVLQSVETPL